MVAYTEGSNIILRHLCNSYIKATARRPIRANGTSCTMGTGGCSLCPEGKGGPGIGEGLGNQCSTACTDGLRLGNGKIGAAVVWWEEAHIPLPSVGVNGEIAFRPVWISAGGVGRRFHLGDNKEVFDMGVYARILDAQTARAPVTRSSRTRRWHSPQSRATEQAPGRPLRGPLFTMV